MKTFKLTSEQITKLLEMTIKLFSEYKNITFETDSNVGAHTYDFNNILFSNEEDIKNHLCKAESIHWFEHVHINLADKIFNSKYYPTPDNSPGWDIQNGLINMNFNQVWIRGYHPVDYIYTEFKKMIFYDEN